MTTFKLFISIVLLFIVHSVFGLQINHNLCEEKTYSDIYKMKIGLKNFTSLAELYKETISDNKIDSLDRLYYSEFSVGFGLGNSYGLMGFRLQYRKYMYGVHFGLGMLPGTSYSPAILNISGGLKVYPLKYIYFDLQISAVKIDYSYLDYGPSLQLGFDKTFRNNFGVNLGFGYGITFDQEFGTYVFDLGIYKSF